MSTRNKRSKKISALMECASLLGEDLWPFERDILVRPDRLKYVRKLVKPKGCVFCVAAKAKPSIKTLAVWQTSLSMVVLNKYPYNGGHVLVIPRRHVGDLTALSEEEYLDLMKLVRVTVRVLQKVYDCEGLNIGLNHGAAAGAGIPEHLHFHVIPRWAGDVNFFPLIAETKVVVETTAMTFSKLKKAFKEIYAGGEI